MVAPFMMHASPVKGDMSSWTTIGVHINWDPWPVEKITEIQHRDNWQENSLQAQLLTREYTVRQGQFAEPATTYDKFNSTIAEQNLNKEVANNYSPAEDTRDLKTQETW